MAVSIPPVLKRYSIPLFLFTLGLFFQIAVLPSSFPTTHYAGKCTAVRVSLSRIVRPLFSGDDCFLLFCCNDRSGSLVRGSVLGVKMGASVQEVAEAYEKLSAKWYSPHDMCFSFHVVTLIFMVSLFASWPLLFFAATDAVTLEI